MPLWSPSGRIRTPCILCKKAVGRLIRYHALNELVARAVSAAAIPNTKEPQGLCRSDGKKPGGLTLVPWQSGRSLVWDVTIVYRLADSYVASAAREAKSVAELAATKKEDKILQQTTFFSQLRSRLSALLMSQPLDFFSLPAKKISHHSGDERETAFFVPACFRAITAIQRRAAIRRVGHGLGSSMGWVRLGWVET